MHFAVRSPRVLVASVMFLFSVIAMASIVLPTEAGAHNRERSSDPADGAVLAVAPTRISFWFKQNVGQDSLTVILIEPSGTRTPLKILRAAKLEAVAELPELPDGTYSVRWKLISSDGHPVTNKVSFTVASGTSAPVSPTPTTGVVAPATAPTIPSVFASVPATVTPTVGASTAAEEVALIQPPSFAVPDDGAAFSTPNWFRWTLRFGSYLAIFFVVGIIMTTVLLWPGAINLSGVRSAAIAATCLVALLAILQIGVLANDIDESQWFRAVWRVRSFDAGTGLAARIALAATLLVMLRRPRSGAIHHRGASLTAIALLATWSYVGHSKSQRWPVVGIPLDVVHHVAAATWMGMLIMVGFCALPALAPRPLQRLLRRLSTLAFVSVILIVSTGVLQSVRLHGLSSDVFGSTHTKLLIAKIVAVIVMLGLANMNRLRVLVASENPEEIPQVRRLMFSELAVGVIVIALTASLVVATPSTAEAHRSLSTVHFPIPFPKSV